MANEYPYDQTSNQPAQVGDFHQAVLDSRAAEQAVTHADPVPSPLPESVRKPDYTSQSAPEPVEQGEQKEGFYETLDRKCWENSGTAQLLRERPENLHDYQGCVNDPKMQPSPSAPSQPVELPPLDDPTQEDLDRSHLLCGLGTRIDVAHRELQGTWIQLQCRERQLLAALRENQQLRRQVAQLTDSRNCAPERTKNLRKRAETAEQQLAQKDARIAELEGGK